MSQDSSMQDWRFLAMRNLVF